MHIHKCINIHICANAQMYEYTRIRDDVKLAQLVRARDCQSQGRRFDSGKKSKTENSNLHGFEIHRPSSKGTKLLFRVIKSNHHHSQPAASVLADVYVGVKTHLCSVHTCPCTSVQNTCSKVHATLTAKNAHIYIPTPICIRIHMYTNTHAHPPSTR